MAKSCKTWTTIKPVNDNYKQEIAKIGARITVESDGVSLTNGAIAFARDGDQWYLANYLQRIYQINFPELTLGASLPIRLEDPEDGTEGITYIWDLDFNDDKVAIASSVRHLVRIYDKATGTKLGQIGTYASPGNVANNKLNEPRGVLWLPNGNLLVASYKGTGATGTGAGHITEYTATGSFVATRMQNIGDGQSAKGKSVVLSPGYMDFDPIDPNYLWIAETGRDRILKVNLTSWQTEEVINVPGATEPTSFCFLNDNTIVAVAGYQSNKVVGINLSDLTIEFELDPKTVGGTDEIRQIIEVEPGYLAVCCYCGSLNSRGVYVMPINNKISVQYESVTIPDGYEIALDKLPNNFDLTSMTAQYPLDCVEDIMAEIPILFRESC